MEQTPLPNKPPEDDHPPPSWLPKWMGERERTAAIIALGLVMAAFILTCGGCCGGVVEWQLIDFLR